MDVRQCKRLDRSRVVCDWGTPKYKLLLSPPLPCHRGTTRMATAVWWPCVFLSVFSLTVQYAHARHPVWVNDKVRILPSSGSTCNFLCYTGIFSSTDGCGCRKNLCGPTVCAGEEICETRVIQGVSVPVCCPPRRNRVCGNTPRLNARFGQRLFYYDSSDNTCHPFRPANIDPNLYFVKFRTCLHACKCRQAV